MLDLALALVVLLGMMLFFGIAKTANVVRLPFLLLLATVTSLGAGVWLSALSVKLRDVRLAVPFLINAWTIATPLAYPSRLLKEMWRPHYDLNPMAGVVEGFRWAPTRPPVRWSSFRR